MVLMTSQGTNLTVADFLFKSGHNMYILDHVLYASCTQRTQLELDSMQQKCDAWKEEVEKLSPLRDQLARATQDNSQLHREVGRLRQDNSRLEAELARASADNTGLARQLEETESAQVYTSIYTK